MPTVSILKNRAVDKIAGGQEVLDRFSSGIIAINDDISSKLFYDRKRVKSVDSILNKIRVKRLQNKGSYSIDEIADIAGYRLVTLYDDQLALVFESVIRTILAFSTNPSFSQFALSNRSLPLFDDFSAEKVISKIKVYRRNTTGDDFYNQLVNKSWNLNLPNEVVSHLNSIIEPMPDRPDAYSSIHILTTAKSYNLGVVKLVPLEIQIRTAIEDIWCEVSHGNKYKADDLYFSSTASERGLAGISSQVDTLKGHIDAISMTVSAIRDQKTQIDKNRDEYYRNKSKARFGSCLLNMSKFQVGDFDRSGNIGDQFLIVDTAIGDANISASKRYNQNVFKALSKLIHLLESDRQFLQVAKSADVDDKFSVLSHSNAIFLLKLEEIRLLTMNAILKPSNRAGSVFQGLLLQLEKLEAEAVKVRPRALINYLKHIQVSNIPAIDTDLDYLRSAVDLLEVDFNLPHDSITRIRIMREYAVALWRGVDSDIQALKRCKLRIETRLESFKYRLLEAFRIMVSASDIHFSLEKSGTIQFDVGSSDNAEELFYTKSQLLITYFTLCRYFSLETIQKSVYFDLSELNRLVRNSGLIVTNEILPEDSVFFLQECREHLLSLRNPISKKFRKIADKRALETIETKSLEICEQILEDRYKTSKMVKTMAKLLSSEIEEKENSKDVQTR